MALNAHGENLDSPTVLWTLVISVLACSSPDSPPTSSRT